MNRPIVNYPNILPMHRAPELPEFMEQAHLLLVLLEFQAGSAHFAECQSVMELQDAIGTCLDIIQATYPHLAGKVQKIVNSPASRGG